MRYAPAMRSMLMPEPRFPGIGLPQPHVFDGLRPQVGPQFGANGGYADALGMGGGGMTDFEKAYLLMSGLGGVGGWLERRDEKKMLEEEIERDRQHRRSMGASWNRAYG